MKTDFNFTTNGYYFRLIPNTPQAEKAYNEGCAQMDLSNIPMSAWASVKYQLKQAGYLVRKLPKCKPMTDSQIDNLLAELEA